MDVCSEDAGWVADDDGGAVPEAERAELRWVAGAMVGGARLAFGIPSVALLAGGADTKPAHFCLRRFVVGVAVGLVAFEHMPGDGHQFAPGGDDGDIPILAFGDAAEEDTDGAGVSVDVLGGLVEHPAGVSVAMCCNRVRGNEKGGVESEVGWVRRNWLEPAREIQALLPWNFVWDEHVQDRPVARVLARE